MARILGVLLLLFATAAAPARVAAPSVGQAQAANLVAEARQKAAEADRLKQILEAREAIESASHDRLEIIGGWLGLIIGLFGALITAVVIFFAIRIERAVIAETRQEFGRQRDLFLAQLESATAAAVRAQDAASLASAEAEQSRQKIRDAIKLAEEFSARHAGSGPKDLTVAQRQTVKEAVALVTQTPSARRSVEEFSVLLLEARLGERWDEVFTLSDELQSAHPDDPAAVAEALYNRGIALNELKNWEASIAAHGELVERFGLDPDGRIALLVDRGRVDMSHAYSKLGRIEESMKHLDVAIERLLGKSNESNHWILRVALYNRACIYALKHDAENAVASLEQWAKGQPFDCRKVIREPDFEPVRSTPAFQALLAAHGCLPD